MELTSSLLNSSFFVNAIFMVNIFYVITFFSRSSFPCLLLFNNIYSYSFSLIFLFLFLFVFCFFGYGSPRKLCVSLRIVYLAWSAPWNNTTLQRVKTRGKQRKKVDRKEAESPEVQLSQRRAFRSTAGCYIYTDHVQELPQIFLCHPYYLISYWATQ